MKAKQCDRRPRHAMQPRFMNKRSAKSFVAGEHGGSDVIDC